MKRLIQIGMLSFMLFATAHVWAQTSTLTVFNEMKEDFTLSINGKVINPTPGQHIKVTGLKPATYTVQAQFVNRSLPAQQMELRVAADRDISYALMRPSTGKGFPAFAFLSEYSVGYFPIAPQASASFVYEGPLNAPTPQGTTTTVIEPQPHITGQPIVPDPIVVQPVRPNPLPGYTGPIGCDYPMDAGAFAEAKKSIVAKSFSETKLQLAKQVTRANCLLTSQVVELMGAFSFESEKLDFAKFAYDFTYDKGNYYKINDAFGFESSIRELEKYLQGK